MPQAPALQVPAESRPSVSAVIIACNEVDVIVPCLQSVVDWADEIIVVDMHSTDGTREVAQRYTARVFDHERLPYVEPARDFALAQARCDWIMMLDPDERVPAPLASELQRIAAQDSVDVVTIPRQHVLFGAVTHSKGAADVAQPRFFRRGVLSWPAEVHRQPDLTTLRGYTIPPGNSDLELLHDALRTFQQVLDKIQRYAPRDAENYQAAGVRFSAVRMVFHAIDQFFGRMFEGRAYQDGMPGFLYTMYWVMYSISVHAELWEKQGRPGKADRVIQRWGRLFAWPGRLIYRTLRVMHRVRGKQPQFQSPNVRPRG